MNNYNFSSYGNYGNSVESWLGVAAGFALFFIVIAIALAVLLIVAYWKLFKKAGKNGWEAIIPYYNSWTLNEISGAHWIWWIVLIIAGAGFGNGISGNISNIIKTSAIASMCGAATILANLVISINIAKKFGKGTGFGVLCALLPIVGYPILAFGSAKYDEKIETAPHGIFDREWNKAHAKEVKKVSNNCPSCNEKITAKMNNCPNCGTKLK